MRLTRQEIYILTFILGALVIGTAVKHYRDRARAVPANLAPATAPR